MTSNGTSPYVRGTKTTRTRTSALATVPAALHLVLTSAEPNSIGEVSNPRSKTGAVVRTTVAAEYSFDVSGRRATRYYVLHFADGTKTKPTVAHEAWTTVPQDGVSV